MTKSLQNTSCLITPRPLGKILTIIPSIFLLMTAVDARGNVVGSDFQNFNPTSNGLDFVTVQSSETLDPSILNLGLFLNFAVNPLPEFSVETTKPVRNTMTAFDLNLGYGLSRDWDFGINIPITAAQTIDAETERVQLASTGVTQVRLNTKLRLSGDDKGGVATIFTVSTDMIKDNPFAGEEPGPTTSLELALDTSYRQIAAGLNFGYRKRFPGDPIEAVPVIPLKDQLIYSLAFSLFFPGSNTLLVTEFFGSSAVSSSLTDDEKANHASGEILAGIKVQANHNLAIHLGGGSTLTDAVSSPDYRVYSGLNYTMGPLIKKPQKVVKKKPAPEVQDYAIAEPIEIPKEAQVETLVFEAPPKPQPPKPLPPPVIYVLNNIEFEFNSSQPTGSATLSDLNQIGNILRNKGFQKLAIEGHTDSVGSHEYNQTLSQSRAHSIKNYLTTRFQLDGSKIVTAGFGETRPVQSNASYQGRQKNRRVEFKIYH